METDFITDSPLCSRLTQHFRVVLETRKEKSWHQSSNKATLFFSLLQVISYITISRYYWNTKRNGSSRTRKDKKGNDRNDVKTKNISYCWLHWRVSLQFYIDHLSYRLWWPQPSNDTTTTTKKDNFSLFVFKKKEKNFPSSFPFYYYFVLFCVVGLFDPATCRRRSFFFLSFVEENPIKEKEQQQCQCQSQRQCQSLGNILKRKH